jgi:hypothetical protein
MMAHEERYRFRIATRAALIRLALLALCIVGMFAYMIIMPGKRYEGELPALTAAQEPLVAALRDCVRTLADDIGERNTNSYASLCKAADYIQGSFSNRGYRCEVQSFDVRGYECRNLVVEIPGAERPAEIVVIGAHYDSVDSCPAANDNGSGVAALLALAGLFADQRPARTLRFVAFANEEPPHFQTGFMGSYVYAAQCAARKERIVAMMSLETMGYYSDVPGSQQYPFPFSLFYPSTGNFIGFIGNVKSGPLVRRAVRVFREHARFPSEGGAIPGFVAGVGWSDHWAFWQHGYPGIMVTDTAPFRYPYYHTVRDRPEALDYERLARVVDGLVPVIADMVK